ncbi:hypothetical protein D3C81_1373220 [compost metagenome]
MVAADDVRFATDGDLDQEKIFQTTGINVDSGSILQPVQGQAPTIDVVHPCADAVGFLDAAQLVIFEHAADAFTNGIQVIEKE